MWIGTEVRENLDGNEEKNVDVNEEKNVDVNEEKNVDGNEDKYEWERGQVWIGMRTSVNGSEGKYG